jgi:2-polyprenyl-6-methoxyphenol hydroxylase-like FAD-dependent oxidoreductase
MEQNSIRLWDNESTEYKYSISCSKSVVIEILKEYLEKVQGIAIDQNQEIIHIEEKNQKLLSSAEISLYYQYRPLPMIHQINDRIMKSIHLLHKKTKQVQVWKSLAIIGADGQTSLVRQKLGTYTQINPHYFLTFFVHRFITCKLQTTKANKIFLYLGN